MTAQQKFRMAIDFSMTILTLLLMGGNYFFQWDGVHEILGVALFVLWAAHIFLNRRWFKSVLKGKYNPFRAMQTFVNCMILLCVIFLMVSGIMLSNHVFSFLNIEGGAEFSRTAHLLASHWYFLFMSLHIGLHASMIFRQISAHKSSSPSKAKSILLNILLAVLCAYGLVAFILRGVWRYLILRQQFFFFDMERGYLLFFIDYIAIIILFATLSHFINRIFICRKNRF